MLPAPIIEGTLPAFYADEKGTVTITVPFSMSRAVNRNEVKGFKLKIKNLQGSTYLKTINSKSVDYDKSIVILHFLSPGRSICPKLQSIFPFIWKQIVISLEASNTTSKIVLVGS